MRQKKIQERDGSAYDWNQEFEDTRKKNEERKIEYSEKAGTSKGRVSKQKKIGSRKSR